MGGLFFSVSCVSFQALFISLHLLIITLFQEDNIFSTNASLTYGPQIQRHICVHRACCERATQPYSLGGVCVCGGGSYLSRLKTSKCYLTLSENGNRVFTHSLDVN